MIIFSAQRRFRNLIKTQNRDTNQATQHSAAHTETQMHACMQVEQNRRDLIWMWTILPSLGIWSISLADWKEAVWTNDEPIYTGLNEWYRNFDDGIEKHTQTQWRCAATLLQQLYQYIIRNGDHFNSNFIYFLPFDICISSTAKTNTVSVLAVSWLIQIAIRNVKVQFGLPGHGWNRNNGNHIIPTTTTPNILLFDRWNFLQATSSDMVHVTIIAWPRLVFFFSCLCLIAVSKVNRSFFSSTKCDIMLAGISTGQIVRQAHLWIMIHVIRERLHLRRSTY